MGSVNTSWLDMPVFCAFFHSRASGLYAGELVKGVYLADLSDVDIAVRVDP